MFRSGHKSFIKLGDQRQHVTMYSCRGETLVMTRAHYDVDIQEWIRHAVSANQLARRVI